MEVVPNDMVVRPWNVLSICSGVGGLDLGVQLAEPGAVAVCHLEREAPAAATLVARMEQGLLHPAPVWSDVGTFDARPWRGIVDCVISGDPCQPNSVAGKGLGEADDRWLLDHVMRIISECRPRRVFRENVPGNADGQLRVIVPALERLGYRVAAGVFSAAEVGASHRRERLFIMADRSDIGHERSGGTWRGRGGPADDSNSLADTARKRSGEARRLRRQRPEDRPAGRGAVVDDAGCDRHGAEHALRAGRHGAVCADGAMGNAPRHGRGQGRAEPVVRCGGNAPAGDGGAMGDAFGCGDGGNAPDEGREQIGRETAFGPSAGTDGAMAQPDSPHVSRGGAGCDAGGRQDPAGHAGLGGGSLPPFAPGPSDPRWGDIIASRPDLAPATERAVRGVADGVAARVDQLRAIGNGVCPLAAANAWASLDALLAQTSADAIVRTAA